MIATIEKEASEYAHLLEILATDEQNILVSSIAKIKKNIEVRSTSTTDKDKIVSTTENDRIIEKLTNGYSYTPAEKIELELTTLQQYFERRRELLSNSFTTTQVAKLLGTSRQTPHDRVKNKSLLAVRDNGQWKFPIWQFDAEGADGVIDGLSEVLKNLSINSEFAKLNWFMRPSPVLDGLTPVEALKQGLKTRVIVEAMGGDASW
ncbi:helix-turn-helix domain-containing protein [Geminocystis sp. CENA526]|uniref:helix-turn-helix domain-containing protein n=1 Tax=Geminocystis sp. CENA526 TaxID=1355871 RepID=UPI003D6F55E1